MWVIANTAGSIISHTTVISIAYLASPDLSGSLGIIIYFLRQKYLAGKAAKGLIFPRVADGETDNMLTWNVTWSIVHAVHMFTYLMTRRDVGCGAAALKNVWRSLSRHIDFQRPRSLLGHTCPANFRGILQLDMSQCPWFIAFWYFWTVGF